MKRKTFKRCNWIVQSKGWKDCGRKATHYAKGIGGYYCPEHKSHIHGWRYEMTPIK